MTLVFFFLLGVSDDAEYDGHYWHLVMVRHQQFSPLFPLDHWYKCQQTEKDK